MGRKSIIETPEEMYQLFQDYKKEVKDNPKLVKDWVGKDADQIYREKEAPLTMVGFEVFVMNNTDIQFPELKYYFETNIKFLPICSRIKREIQADQITGGMTGIYNPSITQRLNGLVEKIEEVNKKPTKIVIK